MPNLSLTVANMTKTLQIASGDVTRWLEAYRARFGLPATATNAEIFDKFSDWLLIDVANRSVITYEKEKAASDAAQNVPPIQITP